METTQVQYEWLEILLKSKRETNFKEVQNWQNNTDF